MSQKKGIIGIILTAFLLACSFVVFGQNVKDIEKQKQLAEKEIKETKAELTANEKEVNKKLNELRKIDSDIAGSQKEIETVTGQLTVINEKISGLEKNIIREEKDLKALREEYLKAVKKMRVARKQNSDIAFLFSSGNFNEARRRMRYMKEFSDWKDRRTNEIQGKVANLKDQRTKLSQAKKDANVALQRQRAVQDRLADQKTVQQATVDELRANSDVLRSRLSKRQAEARSLSNQISRLIAQEQAKEAEARKKSAEEKRLAEERKKAEEKRLAEEKRQAEEHRAEEKRKVEEKILAEKKEESKVVTKPANPTAQKEEKNQPKAENQSEYAEARKRSRTQPASAAQEEKKSMQNELAAEGFENMKGKLPRPVNGNFKIVSAFGVHPISPELPDIMDENLGIDAHVANGSNAVAVYEGEVIKVYDRTNTPGFRNIVVVKHGDYFTVYANLETLSVKTGQKVKQGQPLGSVGADFDDPDYGLIHFEVWKNQTHLNPAVWIK